MLKHLVMAAACAGLIACGGKEQAPEPQPETTQEAISVSDMLASSPDGRVTIDLRSTTGQYRVEESVDASAVTVICPSDRVMNLEKWLPELASEFQTSPAALKQGFTMYSRKPADEGTVTAQIIPVCDGPDCYLHREPDRSYVCFCP